VPAAVLFGAGFGILFGIISYSLTGGRRDFTSSSQIVASEYELLCLPEQAGRARELLGRLHARGEVHALAGPPSGTGAGSSPYGPPPSVPPYGQPPSLYGQPPGQGYPPPPYQSPRGTSQDRPVQPEPPVTGPTYGEMIERQRREREAAERARREREAADRAQTGEHPGAEQTAVQQPPAQQGPGEPGRTEPGRTEPGRTEPSAGPPPSEREEFRRQL
jgi:hypothetical protein